MKIFNLLTRIFQYSVINICFISLLVGCTNEENLDTKNIKRIENFNKINSIDTPIGKYNKPDKLYSRTKMTFDTLGINKIDNNNYVLRIRIISDFENSEELQLVSFCYTGEKWQGKYYRIKEKRFISPYNDTNYVFLQKSISPECGWNKFIDRIFNYDVLSIKNMNELKGFDLEMADGSYSIFEIASKRRYRFYYYFSPELMEDSKYKEVQNVSNIISLIKKNFDLHFVQDK